jgi:hypothetical protein
MSLLPGWELPGTRLLQDELGLTRSDLPGPVPDDSPPHILGYRLRFAADEVNRYHLSLRNLARKLVEVLRPLADGEEVNRSSAEALQSSGTRIDVLAARYSEKHYELLGTISDYRRLRDATQNPAPAPASVAEQQATITNPAPHHQSTRPPHPSGAQLTAMQAIQRGGVFRVEARDGAPRIDTGTPSVRISRATFRALEEQGWACHDSTFLHRGQAISLTPEGERVLAAARDGEPRVRAARARSTKPAPATTPSTAPPPAGASPAARRNERHQP